MSHADIDRVVNADRVRRTRQQIRHTADGPSLPNGAFCVHDGAPHLVWGKTILRYTPAGYDAAQPRPAGNVTVLTPACTNATLSAGYTPSLHPSAKALL